MPAFELERLEDGLAVLVFVLEHHPEDVAVAQERAAALEVEVAQAFEDSLTDVGEETEGRPTIRKIQARTDRSWVAERIVHSAEPLASELLALDVLEKPDLLEVRDVAEVPHDGTHERIVLDAEVVVVQRGDEKQGPSARLMEALRDLESRQGTAGVKSHGGPIARKGVDLGEYPDGRRGSPDPRPVTEPVLEARAVAHRFGSVWALRGVDLEVRRGECVALVGESGSGKTTLLRCFNALVTPSEGAVRVRGRDPADGAPELLRRSIGYVPQDGGLLPHWTVLRNAALVPRLVGQDDAEARARAALAQVGLEPDRFGSRWPRELSGGQRQRVALARALAAEPEVVLLDEPFGALDALTRGDVQELFAELRAARGFSALLVTHDVDEAFRLADRVAVLREGEVLQCAAPDALRSTPREGYVEALLRRSGVLS